MTTNADLKNIYDHPAEIIRKRADEMTRSIPATSAQKLSTYSAAETLRLYEREHGVTFAALDNDALNRVREAYSREITTQNYAGEEDQRARWVELEDAVCDLLGLED